MDRKQIILDFSANTHKNDKTIIERAIKEVKAVDSGKHEIIFKAQLFEKAGDNIVCSHDAFDYLYRTCRDHNYQCTSSVFDLPSLKFLLGYDVPFIKIACRPDLYWILKEFPRKIAAYISVPHPDACVGADYKSDIYDFYRSGFDKCLSCVPEYPASLEKYEHIFGWDKMFDGMRRISDHTIGLDLFRKFDPRIWEKHLKLSDSTGLDAGPFAVTPQELAEIL